jgi:hypothetical protein
VSRSRSPRQPEAGFFKKSPNVPRYIAPEFLQYLGENKKCRRTKVYKTNDIGMIWTQRIPQPLQNLIYRDVAIDPANPQHIFAASNAGVFASTDGGITWGNMSDGIRAGMTVSALSFNAISCQLAASIYRRGVYILNLNAPPTVSISSSANLATTSGLR